MAEGQAETDIAASPDDVWKLVGDFGGLADWMPGMEGCTLEGDVRTIKTMGIEIKEQLKSSDDAARQVSYSIIDSPMPLQNHLATITVTPAGAGSHVTWAVAVTPDEMLGAFQPIYQQSLDALKARLES
ncbi:MAG: SRPBCC family protein [Actinomycetota bacterium]|nr:SRPBCC family protein [Actinomycetota bacterium]